MAASQQRPRRDSLDCWRGETNNRMEPDGILTNAEINKKVTTNNRMELAAAIQSLKALKRSCNIEINTDSAYVKNGITSWIPIWKNNNWKTANKKPVKNVELWQELEQEIHRHTTIEWKWVKAHNGNKWNERADLLARGDVQPNT